MKQLENKRNTKNMYTQFQTNFHLPLQPKRLLIADVTQNQHIPLNWKGVPSEIKNLISYNARDHKRLISDWVRPAYDCQQVFNSSELSRLKEISGCNMVTDSYTLLCDTSFLALVSTVITLLYFFIKIGTWLVDNFHAVSYRTQRLQTTATPNRDQNTQRTADGNKSNTEGQSRDSGYPTISTDNGLRVRTSTTGSEATDIHQYPTYPQGLP